MSPEHFSSRFSLFQIDSRDARYEGFYTPNQSSKEAAVLVPVVIRPTGLHLLFTQRAEHMRQHPGQISFPGGRIEHDDPSFLAAALRETEEEIGIPAAQVKPIGWLPSLHSISNYTIHPLVGFIDTSTNLNLNPDEVAHSFEVPLEHFRSRKNHSTISPTRKNKTQVVHFMPYKNKLIWGVTATIIDKLVLHLG
ncbi:CoA pyrophosphatase [Psychrosphaera sp. 1_MG-2023]|uniref:CoA pyrophosphatase n=1 Tax=Psychrosphaera sp. 1_MG-2023 TaxID=3062643 RepID=UPI0026E3119B|nr:CoA pyrophosphatase [Psychrosphaera sp. 1_MG-2023]MDO6721536.1 CoA pyrophosphatase [Psychrosphaera sp. 1_MG-2023]